MTKVKLARVAARLMLLALVVLLVGCPNPDTRPVVDSSSLATDEIGFNLSLAQDEEHDEVTLSVSMSASTDGINTTARVELSPTDKLSVTVLGQELEPVSVDPATRFTFQQSSLILPATFRVMLTRDGVQPDANETYVTLRAVFETMLPRDGDMFSLESDVMFAWTLRDGDGNPVGGTEVIDTVYSRQILQDATQGVRPYVAVDMESIQSGLDGFSRTSTLSVLQLVPEELLRFDEPEWQFDVAVTGWDENQALPAIFEIDPSLANSKVDSELWQHVSTSYPKSVSITVR